MAAVNSETAFAVARLARLCGKQCLRNVSLPFSIKWVVANRNNRATAEHWKTPLGQSAGASGCKIVGG